MGYAKMKEFSHRAMRTKAMAGFRMGRFGWFAGLGSESPVVAGKLSGAMVFFDEEEVNGSFMIKELVSGQKITLIPHAGSAESVDELKEAFGNAAIALGGGIVIEAVEGAKSAELVNSPEKHLKYWDDDFDGTGTVEVDPKDPNDIKWLQLMLFENGYLEQGEQSGTWDDASKEAWKNFQEGLDIEETGEVNDEALQLLSSSLRVVAPTATRSTPAPVRTGSPKLQAKAPQLKAKKASRKRWKIALAIGIPVVAIGGGYALYQAMMKKKQEQRRFYY